MNNILDINNLCKSYKNSSFSLGGVSFSVPAGSIMGLVGENGAGKTTIINCILNTIFKDDGTIRLFGRDMRDSDTDIREDIGVVFGAINFPENITAVELSKIMAGVYRRWDNGLYMGFLKKFNLPENKRIKTFSRGMAMQLSISAALSHHPKLLILDEATGGLDPVVRDDMLDLFLGFVEDEGHSILISSHITGDLEKIADYITFIHNGKVILSEEKDSLLYDYALMRLKKSELEILDRKDILALRKREYENDVLVKNKKEMQRKYRGAVVDSVSIEDIMILLIKGERL